MPKPLKLHKTKPSKLSHAQKRRILEKSRRPDVVAFREREEMRREFGQMQQRKRPETRTPLERLEHAIFGTAPEKLKGPALLERPALEQAAMKGDKVAKAKLERMDRMRIELEYAIDLLAEKKKLKLSELKKALKTIESHYSFFHGPGSLVEKRWYKNALKELRERTAKIRKRKKSKS